MRKTTHSFNILLFILSLFFTSIAVAQNEHGLLGTNKMMTSRKARCAACAFLTDRYNRAREDVLDQEEYLDDIEADMHRTDRALTQLENEIAGLKTQLIRNPTQSITAKIRAAEQEHAALSRKYGSYERELSSEERYYNDMLDGLENLEQSLNDCEARFCRINNPMSQMLYFHFLTQVQLGLLFGNFSNSRSGYIQTPFERFSGSHSQNNFLFGPQAKLMFGSPELMHMFLLFNAITMFNATNTIMRLRTDAFSNYDSRLRLTTAWMAHFIIGLQSAMFYRNFSLSGGLGGALVNQKIQTSIAEDVITNKSKTETSLAPSAMLSLDYNLCPSCLNGKGLTLSGQVSADYYPSIKESTTTPLGNTYQSKINNDWQFTEALVLSMRF